MSGVHFYTARYRDGVGRICETDYFLASPDAVLVELLRRGLTPLAIRRRRHAAWQREWYSSIYKIGFLKSLAMHVGKSGQTGRALVTVISNEPNPRKRREMQGALAMVEAGQPFSDAMAQLGIFDQAVIAILRGGEKSGMREAIALAIARLETRRRLWQRFRHTLFWLFMEFSTAVATPPMLQSFAIPWLRENAMSSVAKEDLPAFQEKLALAELMNAILIYSTIAGLALIVGLVLAYMTQPLIRERLDRALVRLPLLKGVFIDGAMSASFQIGAAMLRTRSSFEEIARTLATVNRIGPVRSFWERTYRAIGEGYRADEALLRGRLLTRDEQMVIGHHHDANDLEEAMRDFAELRADSADTASVNSLWAGAALMGAYIGLSLLMVFYVWTVFNFSFSSVLNNSGRLMGGA